jgi:signal transduction histidine kinase
LLARKIEQQESAGSDAASLKELKIIEQNVRMCRDLITMWQSYGSTAAKSAKLVSVSEVVREVVKAANGMAAQHGVILSMDFCVETCQIRGEQLQMQRAIQNVVANAIQAAAEKNGGVRVICRQSEQNVELTIVDDGNGIAPEQMPRIFDPYFTTRQGKSGTGLGLYITKKVVDDHHGTIKVDSAVGRGTTFTIRLPLAAA